MDVIHTSNKGDATIAVARVIYQDTLTQSWQEVPNLEGYHQKEGVRDIKLGEDLSEDRVKLTGDIPIRCKPYILPNVMKEELRNEVDSMLEMGVVYRPLTSP